MWIFTKTAIFTLTVNKQLIVNIQGALTKQVVRILRDIPGVTVDTQPLLTEGRRPDILISAGDVTHVVELKTQRVTNAAAARQLADYARRNSGETRLLLVAQSTTEGARHTLEEAGIAVIDGLGNMRVELPGMYIWAEGRHDDTTVGRRIGEPPVNLRGRAGVATQVLLMEPQRLWGVNELANIAEISTALAHRVLRRLEREKIVVVEGVGPQRVRRVTNPTALLDLWVEEMQDRKVRQLRGFRLARNPRTLAKILSEVLGHHNIEHAVTGAAGAAQLAPFISAIPITDVWITETYSLEEVAANAGLEVVNDGHNVIFRQALGDGPLAFREKVKNTWTVNKFRLYFDLRSDPRRGIEQANRLREEIIGF
jgi:hypothetical protein